MEKSESLCHSLIQVYVYLQKIIKKPKPLIAKNCVENHLDLRLMLKDFEQYEKVRRHLFLFYVLFAQNTNDKFTSSAVFNLVNYLKSKDYIYELEEFKSFFYKHKEEYTLAITELSKIIDRSYYERISFSDLLKVKRIGHKSASLIYNEFFEPSCFPVVDVHCHKGYLKIAEKYNLPKIKNTYDLFIKLSQLSNHCDMNIGFKLSNLLYSYNKFN